MRWFSQPGMDTHRSRGIEISETWPSFGRRMAMTMVSVRKEPPGRLSEPISRKLTGSCPLLRTWLPAPDGSIVENGTMVFWSRLGSMVGIGVTVGGGSVAVAVAAAGGGSNVPVG